jgi:ribonucleoside-diphosphate reductase alpha chain
MEFIRYHAMQTSIKLAEERGAFPAITGSIYDPAHLTWTPPIPITPYERDFKRPSIDWETISIGIKQHGIRNAAQTTIAPTGTIATVAGCEGYGCEPVFALAYIRHVNDNGHDLPLTYASPQFETALVEAGIDEVTRTAIIEEIMETGTCQGNEAVPEQIQHVFAVSQDISAEEHVRMQAAMQAFVDNSLSKTVNFPSNATEDDVATAYKLAWKLGCKGITVYVTGSRQKVVLETKATSKEKEGLVMVEPVHAEEHNEYQPGAEHVWSASKKPRPKRLRGYTYTIGTPVGKAFVTVNENGGDHPFEVFISTAKAGSETAAVSEAIGRLISYLLRLASPVLPRERLKEIVNQLSGIGGGRSLGFGPNRVRSLPDGVAQTLAEYLDDSEEYQEDAAHGGNGNYGKYPVRPSDITESLPSATTVQPAFQIGDLCPECGQAAVVNEEGCRKCYACGYSEC